MIRIAVRQAAYEAIERMLALGTAAFRPRSTKSASAKSGSREGD
jgi:hypothetical protein